MSEQMAPDAETKGHNTPQLPRERLGDIVVKLGFCDRDAVEDAVAVAALSGELLGQVLLERGAVTTDQLAIAMAKRFGLEHRDSRATSPAPAAATLVSYAAARRMRRGAGHDRGDDTLVVAIANPENFLALEDVSMFTGMQIKPVVVSQEDLDTLLQAPQRARRRADRADEASGRRSPTAIAARDRGRRADDQARALDHLRRRRPRRLGHPLRPRRRRAHASASASTA